MKVDDEDLEDEKVYETYRRIQLDHFYDALLLAGLPEQEKKPSCWRLRWAPLFKEIQKILTKLRKKVVTNEQFSKINAE